jgi:type IV pilus assembly protein PilM
VSYTLCVSLLTRIFPTPELHKTVNGIVPGRFNEIQIPAGCMQGGRVSDEKKFTEFLQDVKKQHKLNFVRVAIPESQIYLFTLSVDSLVAHDIRSAIELSLEDNIPLKAIETVFDFSILKVAGSTIVVQVVAVAETTATTLFSCFMNAGMTPLSFELDAQAIARSVVPRSTNASHLVIDVGAHRTGITVTVGENAVYTATIEFGGEMLTQTLSSKLSITPAEAEELKKTIGLQHTKEHEQFFTILSDAILPLKDEINRRFIYWQDRKEQLGGFPRIESVIICGGHSNLTGLADYLSAALKLPVTQANPWTNCFSYEEYIPVISFEKSMSYVTAIGLSLTDHIND